MQNTSDSFLLKYAASCVASKGSQVSCNIHQCCAIKVFCLGKWLAAWSTYSSINIVIYCYILRVNEINRAISKVVSILKQKVHFPENHHIFKHLLQEIHTRLVIIHEHNNLKFTIKLSHRNYYFFLETKQKPNRTLLGALCR